MPNCDTAKTLPIPAGWEARGDILSGQCPWCPGQNVHKSARPLRSRDCDHLLPPARQVSRGTAQGSGRRSEPRAHRGAHTAAGGHGRGLALPAGRHALHRPAVCAPGLRLRTLASFLLYEWGKTRAAQQRQGRGSSANGTRTLVTWGPCPVRNRELCSPIDFVRSAGREGRGAQDMTIPSFMSGVILGGLLGVLVGLCVSQRWLHAWRRTRDIDRLVEQFQALFRQRGQEHHPHP